MHSTWVWNTVTQVSYWNVATGTGWKLLSDRDVALHVSRDIHNGTSDYHHYRLIKNIVFLCPPVA
jgi:hypothetical protein